MKEFVLELKRAKIDLYKKDYHEMIAAYNRELATISGYNGRQILELLQNCDDQKSESVLIEIDRNNNRLLIANEGVSFSEAGYRSLATSNLSSKIDKTQYIGNKGLGFRSILNWSNEVSIYSNGFKVTYSSYNKEKAFDEAFDDTTKDEIRAAYNFQSTVYPIPILSVPEIRETNEFSEYAAVIELNYKGDFIKSIDDQIKAITTETILFLHYIKTIKFIGFDSKIDIYINRETENLVKGSVQKITNDVEIWDIYQDEGVLPEKYQNEQGIKQNYQIRIAVPRNTIKSSYKLYSFFATNINLYFPYIIHATFDLDQNRKHLENSDKNKFVVEKLTQLMSKMALFKTEDIVDWSAFKLLQYNTENENLQELGFYKELDKIIYEEKIIPCASDRYYAQNEVVYLGEDFANLIQLANAGSVFSKHIKPVFSGINFEVFKPRYTGYSDFVKAIDDWSLTITAVNVRTQLIQYLVKRNNLKGLSDSFNVLLNEKSKVINKKNEIFTHLNNDLEIPDFCLIEVLHPSLFDSLINVFNIKEDSKKDRARALQGLLKSIANVHSYEFIPLSRKIVNNTHSHFVKEPEKKIDTIKKMISALCNNYDSNTNYTSIGVLDVPLLDKNNNIVKASDLYFSDDYLLGQICLDIFGETHQKRNQVNNIESLGLENKNVNDVQKFLSWLGVNKFVKYHYNTITNTNHSYVRRVVGYATTANVQVLDFEEREILLENLTAEQFILWVIKDSNLSDNLNQLEKKHGEVVKYKYHSNNSKSHIKSYLAELVEEDFYNFRNHLMDNTFKSINDIEIDYSSSLFKKHNIKRKDIDLVLRQLGACSDFNELSIERVQEILEKINTVYENGRNTSAYYRRAYLHYEENEKHLKKNLKLFARDHEGLKLFNQDQIYFSDKVKLPNKLRAEFPVFNFPKRSGGKKAIEFFGINDLSEIKIELDDFDKDDLVTKLLHDYLVELYPFILIHRINALDNETTKRKDASKLQQLIINVCSEVVTKVDKKLFTLDNYEFIFLENSGYYLKLPNQDSIETVKRHSNFKDSIADILSHLFDVSGHKSDFRALLSTDLNDVKHITKVNFGEDLLDETLEILGFSNSMTSFWSSIYRIKGQELSFDEENTVDINQINKDLNLSLQSHLFDYTTINNEVNLPYLMDMFSKLDISIQEFNSYSLNSLDLYDFHLKKLTPFFINKFNIFKQSLHSSSNTRKLRENFLQRLHDFEVRLDVFVKSVALENRFKFSLFLAECFDLFMQKEFEEVTLIELKDSKDIDSIYEKNKLLLLPKEFEIVQNSKRVESLLYFEIDIEIFKKENLKPKKIDFLPPIIEGKPSNGEVTLKEKKVVFFKTKSRSGYKNRKELFNPNGSSIKTKTELGKTSEEKVYNHLCEKYAKEFVHNKAKEDEGLHYDLRYSPDKGNKYIYVEVKTFSKDTFIISREEYEFGLEKKDLYEIWLVKNDEVIIFDYKLEETNLIVKDYYVAFSELEIA